MSTFNKIKVKHATIADKIYIKESDIEDLDSFIQAYTYLIGDEILFTYEHDEEKDLYAVPSNSYKKLSLEQKTKIMKKIISKKCFTMNKIAIVNTGQNVSEWEIILEKKINA